MRKGVYQIELKDGRVFRIFYDNSTQEKKLLTHLSSIKDKIVFSKVIVNGVHTFKEFKNQHLKTI